MLFRSGVLEAPDAALGVPQVHVAQRARRLELEALARLGLGLRHALGVEVEEQVHAAVAKTVETFGGIDILINNASAISLTPTSMTPMKKFDLMHSVNVRATYLTTQACLPHLEKGDNPHVLMNSPPLNMAQKWFENHVAYTMSKYGMSMCVLGMSGEFKDRGIGVNAIWPRTAIATSAVGMLGGDAMMKASRKPEIMADAAYWILTQDSKSCTGNFFIDDEVLKNAGVTDLDHYAYDPEIGRAHV